MQQNTLMSVTNLVAGVQRGRAQLNQIGVHTVIQISLESNTQKPNMLTWAESPSSLQLPPCPSTKMRMRMGGAEIKMNLHLNQPGSRTKMRSGSLLLPLL